MREREITILKERVLHSEIGQYIERDSETLK